MRLCASGPVGREMCVPSAHPYAADETGGTYDSRDIRKDVNILAYDNLMTI